LKRFSLEWLWIATRILAWVGVGARSRADARRARRRRPRPKDRARRNQLKRKALYVGLCGRKGGLGRVRTRAGLRGSIMAGPQSMAGRACADKVSADLCTLVRRQAHATQFILATRRLRAPGAGRAGKRLRRHELRVQRR